MKEGIGALIGAIIALFFAVIINIWLVSVPALDFIGVFIILMPLSLLAGAVAGAYIEKDLLGIRTLIRYMFKEFFKSIAIGIATAILTTIPFVCLLMINYQLRDRALITTFCVFMLICMGLSGFIGSLGEISWPRVSSGILSAVFGGSFLLFFPVVMVIGLAVIGLIAQ